MFLILFVEYTCCCTTTRRYTRCYTLVERYLHASYMYIHLFTYISIYLYLSVYCCKWMLCLCNPLIMGQYICMLVVCNRRSYSVATNYRFGGLLYFTYVHINSNICSNTYIWHCKCVRVWECVFSFLLSHLFRTCRHMVIFYFVLFLLFFCFCCYVY